MAVAILYPGSMGSSLAASIHACSPSIPLLTHLAGRSESTRARAEKSGLKDATLLEIVQQSRIIISILPPSEALKLAAEIVAFHEPSAKQQPIFLDANAVSTTTALQLAEILSAPSPPIPFVDGCVIGGPARDGYDPKIYLSAAEENEAYMKEILTTLGGGGKGKEGGKGLQITTMPGAGVGGASALKMSYAGITKGSTGLFTTMVLAANAHSPKTAQYLLDELSSSQVPFLTRSVGTVKDMLPKAYRFVGEMEEISGFIASPTGKTPAPAPTEERTVSDIYLGIAKLFDRIAETGKDVKMLLEWVERGKELLAAKK